MMTPEEVLDLYQSNHALWSFDYDGDPEAPHAEWTGGLCADGYTNSRIVLCDPQNVRILALALADAYSSTDEDDPDWVVGSAYASIALSYELARTMRTFHAFVKKDFAWDEVQIPPNARVLQCEELIATGGTTLRARTAVANGNTDPIKLIPSVVTVMHYPNHTQPDLSVLSLATRNISVWNQGECPLCQRGSKRLRPAQNWNKFKKL